nr:ribonuclease H-like domain-containing protein [Tanacetum cinerariifolium]
MNSFLASIRFYKFPPRWENDPETDQVPIWAFSVEGIEPALGWAKLGSCSRTGATGSGDGGLEGVGNKMHKAFLLPVIKFDDSYKVPTNSDLDNTTTRKDDEQSGRTVTITTEDMQRKKNDVKARTTLLLSLLDEHQLRFSKYKTAKELWAAILKTFGGNKATKKRKKNLLKQQYGNFKAEGSETLEQTFNRLQVINMAFISSSKNNSGNKDTSSTTVPSYMANEGEDHALVADAEAPT